MFWHSLLLIRVAVYYKQYISNILAMYYILYSNILCTLYIEHLSTCLHSFPDTPLEAAPGAVYSLSRKAFLFDIAICSRSTLFRKSGCDSSKYWIIKTCKVDSEDYRHWSIYRQPQCTLDEIEGSTRGPCKTYLHNNCARQVCEN